MPADSSYFASAGVNVPRLACAARAEVRRWCTAEDNPDGNFWCVEFGPESVGGVGGTWLTAPVVRIRLAVALGELEALVERARTQDSADSPSAAATIVRVLYSDVPDSAAGRACARWFEQKGFPLTEWPEDLAHSDSVVGAWRGSDLSDEVDIGIALAPTAGSDELGGGFDVETIDEYFWERVRAVGGAIPSLLPRAPKGPELSACNTGPIPLWLALYLLEFPHRPVGYTRRNDWRKSDTQRPRGGRTPDQGWREFDRQKPTVERTLSAYGAARVRSKALVAQVGPNTAFDHQFIALLHAWMHHEPMTNPRLVDIDTGGRSRVEVIARLIEILDTPGGADEPVPYFLAQLGDDLLTDELLPELPAERQMICARTSLDPGLAFSERLLGIDPLNKGSLRMAGGAAGGRYHNPKPNKGFRNSALGNSTKVVIIDGATLHSDNRNKCYPSLAIGNCVLLGVRPEVPEPLRGVQALRNLMESPWSHGLFLYVR